MKEGSRQEADRRIRSEVLTEITNLKRDIHPHFSSGNPSLENYTINRGPANIVDSFHLSCLGKAKESNFNYTWRMVSKRSAKPCSSLNQPNTTGCGQIPVSKKTSSLQNVIAADAESFFVAMITHWRHTTFQAGLVDTCGTC